MNDTLKKKYSYLLSSIGKGGRNKKIKPMPNQHASEEEKEKVNKRENVGQERKTTSQQQPKARAAYGREAHTHPMGLRYKACSL